jgi:glycosyltransferase involved in cell wall biosynthesis
VAGVTEAFPTGPLAKRIDHLHQMGSPAQPYDAFGAEPLVAEIIGILGDPGFGAMSQGDRGAVLFRILLIYSGTWNQAGRLVIPAVEAALAQLLAEPEHNLDVLCVAYDLLYFLYWCWEPAVAQQLGFARNVVAPFAAAVRAQLPPRGRRDRFRQQLRTVNRRVGYLAEFVSPGPGNAIAGANQVLLRTLAEAGGPYRPILYAWMFHDPDSLAAYEAMGVEVRMIRSDSPGQRAALAEAAIRADAPDVLLTDMNAAVPAVLFERRVAPLQVFYQFGLPLWPLANIDAVFHVWDFDRAVVGFDPGICTELKIPYSLERFAQPADPVLLAAERKLLPAGRLVGTYGRLAKVTPEFLAAVAVAIRDVPDVTVVLGGSGDPGPIHQVLAQLGCADRFSVHARYVQGHLWGHLLDAFLDTFPQPGGASCLEVIAKGKPVICLAGSEASNLAREQRVPALVARDANGYGAILHRLLTDPDFATEAATATHVLAASFPTEADYGRDLTGAIDRLRARRPDHLLARLGRGLGVGG